MSWAAWFLVYVLEAEVAVVLVDVNEASTVVANIRVPLPLALANIGAGVGVGEGGEVLAIWADVGTSFSFADTILALLLIGVGAKARMKVARETEGALLSPGTDVSVTSEALVVPMGPRVGEVPECAAESFQSVRAKAEEVHPWWSSQGALKRG